MSYDLVIRGGTVQIVPVLQESSPMSQSATESSPR